MKRCIAALVCAVTALISVSAQHFELTLERRTSPNSFTLTLANPLYAPHPTTTIGRAMREIEQQIDDRRATDAGHSPLQPFWEAGFWSSPLMKLIPIPLGPSRYVEDPSVTPAYITVGWQHSEYQLRTSDERARFLFGPITSQTSDTNRQLRRHS